MQWFVTALILWSGGGASLGAFGLWQMRRDAQGRAERPRSQRWDSSEAEVAEWGQVLRSVDTRPTVQARQIRIAPSPYLTRVVDDLTWEERRDRFAAYVQRFAARLDRMSWALDTDTREFDELVAREFGARVAPAEPRCTRVVGVPALTAAGAVR